MAVNPHNPNPIETLELKDQPRLDADTTKGKRFEGQARKKIKTIWCHKYG